MRAHVKYHVVLIVLIHTLVTRSWWLSDLYRTIASIWECYEPFSTGDAQDAAYVVHVASSFGLREGKTTGHKFLIEQSGATVRVKLEDFWNNLA